MSAKPIKKGQKYMSSLKNTVKNLHKRVKQVRHDDVLPLITAAPVREKAIDKDGNLIFDDKGNVCKIIYVTFVSELHMVKPAKEYERYPSDYMRGLIDAKSDFAELRRIHAIAQAQYEKLILSKQQGKEYKRPDFGEPIGEICGIWSEIDEGIKKKCADMFDMMKKIKSFNVEHYGN